MLKKYLTPLEVVVFFPMLAIFGAILFYPVHTDIQEHVDFLQKVAAGVRLPPTNFLYYATVYLFALFSTDTTILYISSAFVLALAVTAKFSITRLICTTYYRDVLNRPAEDMIIRLAPFLLLLVFCLPGDRFYVGQLPPNIWHNSTTIYLMPFALALFWLASKQLVEPTSRRNALMTLLCVFNVVIKGSFLVVFALSYPLMLLKRYGLGRMFFSNLIPVIVGVMVTGIAYYLIYELSYGNHHDVKAGIVVRPFWVWSHFSSNMPLSLFYSLAFPVVYLAFYRGDFIRHVVLQHAVVAYLIALFFFIVFSETGPREFHLNFIWQCIICGYFLFVFTAVLFADKIRHFGLGHWKNLILSAVFTAHVAAGVLYLAKLFYYRSFY